MTLTLLAQETSSEVKSFASSILKDKMKFDYGQLTPELFPQVHQAILELAAANPQPEYGMLSNIALALVYVYMQESERIGGLLEYLSEYLGKKGLINYVFMILLLLPEEVDNYKVVVEEKKREAILKYIKSIQTKVLCELNIVAAQQWDSKKIKRETLLDCLSNWIELGYSKDIM